MKKTAVRNLALAALFLAAGIVLPFFTGQIPQVGSMMLPMHLPVLLCGLICGWRYGGAVGFILPLVRFLLFGMPPVYPTGIAMCFELAAYGIVTGLCYARMPKHLGGLYGSLIAAMVSGRLIWGAVRVLLSGVSGSAFTWQLFMSGAFLTAIPGIVVQLVFIPAMMVILQKTGVLPRENRTAGSAPSAA